MKPLAKYDLKDGLMSIDLINTSYTDVVSGDRLHLKLNPLQSKKQWERYNDILTLIPDCSPFLKKELFTEEPDQKISSIFRYKKVPIII